MRTSTGLSLIPAPMSFPHHGPLHGLALAARAHLRSMVASIDRTAASRRKRRAWRQNLPWDVGLDHLAEQASPPWIPRGW